METPRARGQGRGLLWTNQGINLAAFGATEWALLGSVAIIWGASFALIEEGLKTLEPGLVAFMRVALGGLTLLCIPRARRALIEPGDQPRIALLGVVWLGIPLLLFPVAQQWIDSSVAGMINGAMPLTTAAWAVLLMRRLPGRVQLVGLGLGCVGVVAIWVPELPATTQAGTAGTAFGVLLAIFAVILYGLSANLAVGLQQRYGALPVLLRAQAAGLVVLTPFALLGLPRSTFTWASIAAMLALGIVGTGLGFVLMTTLVGRVGGPRGTVAIYFVPLVAVVLGIVWHGEQVHPIAALGASLVVVGAWLTSRRASPGPGPEAPVSDRPATS